MEEVLLEICKRVSRLGDFTRLAATCTAYHSLATTKRYWLSFFDFLEPQTLKEPRFVNWLNSTTEYGTETYSWLHWRQLCFYYFNRQSVFLRMEDFTRPQVKRLETCETSEEKAELIQKIEQFLATGKTPFHLNGDVQYIEKGAIYIAPKSLLNEYLADDENRKKFCDASQKQPFLLNHFGPHYVSHSNDESGVRVGGELIYKTWFNTWDLIVLMCQEQAPNLPLHNSTSLAELFNSVQDSIAFPCNPARWFTDVYFKPTPLPVGRIPSSIETRDDGGCVHRAQIVLAEKKFIDRIATLDAEKGGLVKFEVEFGGALAEPEVEDEPVEEEKIYWLKSEQCLACAAYPVCKGKEEESEEYYCSDCHARLCFGCVQKFYVPPDEIKHNDNRDWGYIVPNSMQKYPQNLELGIGRGGLILRKEMLRTILDSIGLLEHPLTNNIRTNFKDLKSERNSWNGDDRFEYFASQYTIMPTGMQHKGIVSMCQFTGRKNYPPILTRQETDDIYREVIDNGRALTDFVPNPNTEGVTLLHDDAGLVRVILPNNGRGDGNGSCDLHCPDQFLDTITFDEKQPVRTCYRSFIPERDAPFSWGDVMLPLQTLLDETRVNYYLKRIEALQGTGKVLGTVIILGFLCTNYTLRHSFVLDGHHKLAAVAKWNATHDQKAYLNVLSFVSQPTNTFYDEDQSFGLPSKTNSLRDIIDMMIEKNDSATIEKEGCFEAPIILDSSRLRRELWRYANDFPLNVADMLAMTKEQFVQQFVKDRKFILPEAVDAIMEALAGIKAGDDEALITAAPYRDRDCDAASHAFRHLHCSYL